MRPRPILKGALSAMLWVAALSIPYQPALGDDGAQPTLSDGDLEAIRGGFETGRGLAVSFGVEQAAYINGVLQATTTLTVPRLDPAFPSADAPATLIQHGLGDSVILGEAGALAPGMLTLIQNTLDHQVIQNLTIIDAAVTSLDLFREQIAQSLMQLPF